MEESPNTVVACQFDDPYANVNLVERNPKPNGFELVDPYQSGKKNQFDLVELAARIQTADQVFGLTPHIKYPTLCSLSKTMWSFVFDKNR